MKIYISGKITGLKKIYAETAFKLAWKELMMSGKYVQVINPFWLDHSKNTTYWDYIRTDLKALSDCQAIYMLDNWKTSNGAWIELLFSIITFKRIYFQ